MPIRINLLAETQTAEDLRRRDPVKRVVLFGLVAVAAMFVWFSIIKAKVIMADHELNLAQIQMNTITNEYQLALNNDAKVAASKTKLAELAKLTNARLLQGNLMNALQKVSVDNVQLTGIRVDQAYTESGGGKQPASTTEKIVVLLNARDSSPNPGDQVGKFSDALARESYFQKMLDKPNGVRLADESSAQQDSYGKNFVTFTLECHFPEIKR